MQAKSVDFSKSDVKMGKNDIFRTVIFLYSKHATYFDRLLRIIISTKRTFCLYGIIAQLKKCKNIPYKSAAVQSCKKIPAQSVKIFFMPIHCYYK